MFPLGILQGQLGADGVGVQRLGREPLTNPVIDTLEMARSLYSGLKNYRLNTLCKHFGIELKQHHRAIHDAEATGYLLWKMVEDCLAKEVVRLDQLNEITDRRDVSRLRPFHVVLLVQNATGLKYLYKLISLSHLEYFHRVPRIPRSELEKHREGLIVGSGCEKGELFEAALQKSPQEAEEIARFYDYIEIQPVEVPSLIDELPVLAAMAARRAGMRVTGASELRVKESDRIREIVQGLRAFGADAEELPDGFEIGPAPLHAASVDARLDHRLAMAFAIAGLGIAGTHIAGAQVVDVSYPGFLDLLAARTT